MSIADELQKFAELRDKGILSQEEFAAAKTRLLALPVGDVTCQRLIIQTDTANTGEMCQTGTAGAMFRATSENTPTILNTCPNGDASLQTDRIHDELADNAHKTEFAAFRAYFQDYIADPDNRQSVEFGAHSDGYGRLFQTRVSGRAPTKPHVPGLTGQLAGSTCVRVTWRYNNPSDPAGGGVTCDWAFGQAPSDSPITLAEAGNPVMSLWGGTGEEGTGRRTAWLVDKTGRNFYMGSFAGFAFFDNCDSEKAPGESDGTRINGIKAFGTDGTGGFIPGRQVAASWTPGAIDHGLYKSHTVNVPGASLGDFVIASVERVLADGSVECALPQGCTVSASVSSPDVVTFVITNTSGGNHTIRQLTARAAVLKKRLDIVACEAEKGDEKGSG